MSEFEVWEDPATKVRFCFSHSSTEFTTGVMIIPPNTELPKHNRPLAFENLLQVSGVCTMRVYENDDSENTYTLKPMDTLAMDKGQWHIHANPSQEESYTLFKAVGDITTIVGNLKNSFTRIEADFHKTY
jgi:quercetin dioxygenase-like cupin family protein